jgi:hypothetical protein
MRVRRSRIGRIDRLLVFEEVVFDSFINSAGLQVYLYTFSPSERAECDEKNEEHKTSQDRMW